MGNSLRTPPHRHRQQKQHHNTEEDEEPPDARTQIMTCEICIEPIESPNKIFKNNNLCTHPFCVDCIIKYIQVKLEDNAAEISCPALSCAHSLDALSCRPILPPQTFVKWCDVLCESLLLGLDSCYCPFRDCSVLILNECGGGDQLKKSKCPNCKRLFCYSCKIPWHAGFRCEERGDFREPNDVAFGLLAERNRWIRCPRCRLFVERREGCYIITCRCWTSFCYRCGKKVNRHWCSCDRASILIRVVRNCGIMICGLVVLYLLLQVYRICI